MHELERDLGPFEHLLWLTDRWTPRHFAVVARIRGGLNAPWLRAALLRAQRRHPALRARIDCGNGGCPRFVAGDRAEIPLRIRDRVAGDVWHVELVSELATPFDTTATPLVRVVLVQGPSVSELIMLVHHALGDALGAAFLVRELLDDLASAPTVRPHPPRPPMEELLGLPHRCVPSPNGDAASRRFAGRAAALEVWESEPGWAGELVDRCRRQRTTVQGALTAAFTLALAESGRVAVDGAVRCLSPISVRRLCPPVGTDFGLYLTSARTCHRPTTATDLWELARVARDQIAAGLTHGRLSARVAGQQALLARRPTPEAAHAAYRRAVDYQAVISNIGRFWINNCNRPVRVEALWVVPNFEDEPVVSIATVDRRMCATVLGEDTVPGLLQNALGRLEMAGARSDFALISRAA
jgi:hypothetical protein